MDHCVADFHAGGESIKDDATDLVLEEPMNVAASVSKSAAPAAKPGQLVSGGSASSVTEESDLRPAREEL